MADLFQLESGLTESSSPSGLSPASSTLSTGDLRRKYNFGDRVSELAISQDPFFRFVSKVAKRPTDDPEFKFTERRPSFHKRYAYVTGWSASTFVGDAGTMNDATVTSTIVDGAGDVIYVQMETDYKSAGNITNIYGSTSNAFKVGASGTMPAFFMVDQLVKIPFQNTNAAASTAATACIVDDYIVGKVLSATEYSGVEAVVLKLEIVRPLASSSSGTELSGWGAGGTGDQGLGGAGTTAAETANFTQLQLEASRSYVVGTAHGQGTGYPATWKDEPFSTSYGRTQIWKTAMAMDNTTRATVLKYEANEWARVWKEKLIEHKWDIEQSLLFGTQYKSSDGSWQTQGAVDYILSYSNVFSLTHSSKTQDEFLDDMSNFLDPRYNNANATLFFCDTATYNWLHKLTGYFQNNLEISPNFRADMSLSSKKKVFGVDINVISTPYGDMNVARNVHLDGSEVKILAINMKYAKYRPLVGNGLNRDTSIYVGVQTLENSGVDRRVDQILTEAGMEWSMAESHAIWT